MKIFHLSDDIPKSKELLKLLPLSNLEEIKSYILNIYENINNELYSYSYSIENLNKSNDLFKSNIFLSKKILEDINKEITSLIKVNINYNGLLYSNLINIYISKSSNIKYLNNFLDIIIPRILFFNELKKTKEMPNNIILICLDKPKVINIENNIKSNFEFNSDMINSGLTDHLKKEIIIYRNEEMIKVLIHELIHFHNLDKFIFQNNLLDVNISKKILNYYNLPNDNYYAFDEARTEALACIFHIIMFYYENTKNKNNTKNINLTFQKELQFNLFQISKIIGNIYNNNLKEIINILKKNSLGKSGILKLLKQNTCVFSYFILKTLLLLDPLKLFNIKKESELISLWLNDELLSKLIIDYLKIIEKNNNKRIINNKISSKKSSKILFKNLFKNKSKKSKILNNISNKLLIWNTFRMTGIITSVYF